MIRIKRILLSTFVALGLVVPAMVPSVAHAQLNSEALKCGADLKFQTTECAAETEAAGTSVNKIITQAIDIISIIVGLIAVVMIIIAGFKYITSQGESGAVSGAKNTIIYAIVGLVVVALAQVIVKFVIGKLTEEPTTGG